MHESLGDSLELYKKSEPCLKQVLLIIVSFLVDSSLEWEKFVEIFLNEDVSKIFPGFKISYDGGEGDIRFLKSSNKSS